MILRYLVVVVVTIAVAVGCLVLALTLPEAQKVTRGELTPGTLNVVGHALAERDVSAIKARIAQVSRDMRATITIVVTSDTNADPRRYDSRVYDAVVEAQPTRDIVIVIMARRNPYATVASTSGFVGFDSLKVETDYLYPALRTRDYNRAVNAALDGILAQKA
jgi:uncharacterized membrane protein YgcG